MRSLEEIDADMARQAQARYDADQNRIKEAARKVADAEAAKDAEIARLSAALDDERAQLEAERARNADVKAWLIDWPDEPDLGHYFAEEPSPNARSRALVLRDVAPPLAIIPGDAECTK